jgi:hypothetical protein
MLSSQCLVKKKTCGFSLFTIVGVYVLLHPRPQRTLVAIVEAKKSHEPWVEGLQTLKLLFGKYIIC